MNRLGLGCLLGLFSAVLLPLRAAADTAVPRQPGERDTCPVCGMFVSPHSEWLAQVVFSDGSAVFFDGSKDLFKYLARDEPSPDPPRRIEAIFVTDYYQLEVIPARRAHYVAGSDVYGPMGPELVPHPTRAEAEDFLRDHGGTGILRFEEVTAEILESLSRGHGRKR